MTISAFRTFPRRRVVTRSLLLMASTSLYAQQPASLSLNGAAERHRISQ